MTQPENRSRRVFLQNGSAVTALTLAPAVRAAGADVVLVAPGISCRQQIEHLTGRQAKHPAEALWDSLRPE